MSYQPVYVPRSKRKRPVAAEETTHNVPECTPASEVLSKVQRPEDFMDERDHNEWGGPTRVRAEFESQAAKSPTSTRHEDLLSIRALDVGDKLLRKLGWRDQTRDGTSSKATLTAYLPVHSSADSGNGILKVGSKQLQKIALQQSRVIIPHPWKGRWGLGYQSELRVPTRREGGSSQYRISNVVVHKSGVTETAQTQAHAEYEANTLQDFVGTHSTAGFALREDEDDAYDDSMGNEKSFHSTVLGVASQKRSERNHASLQSEAYEHEDSDHETEQVATKTSGEFQNALSSWAIGGDSKESDHCNAGTIEGFVLGSSAPTKRPKLYRGPDVPKDWHIQPHQFGPNEHPSILKAIAHATKLSVAKERRAKSMNEALQAATLKRRSVFKGIGEQMKSRFAAAGSLIDEPRANETPTPKKSITRTVRQFVPDPLLCKRLNVASIPKQQPTSAVAVQRRDEAFFQNEVMGAVAKASKQQSAETIAIMNDENPGLDDEPQRPALEVYKSIFDPDIGHPEDEEGGATASSDEQEDAPGAKDTNLEQSSTITVGIASTGTRPDHFTDIVEIAESSDNQSSFDERRKRRKREKSGRKSKKRHKKKHKKRDDSK